MDRKELVKAAVHMRNPERVPLLLYNRDYDQSDIIVIEVEKMWDGPNKDTSEWGFMWERADGTMGQPVEPLIPDWNSLDQISFPNPHDPSRFTHVAPIMEKYGSRYYVASLALTGFTIMTILRGFSNTLEDLYLEPEKLKELAEMVFEVENEIIKQVKEFGFDAVAFFDDWGSQTNLFISPQMWRDFFKPFYQKQFDLVHSYGMDVYFHSCGQITSIIPDFIEMGVDILNLSQPNIFDIKELGEKYSGSVCFLCPISYQTTSLSGTRQEIFDEAERLISNLGCEKGGFIAYVEEYASIGLSEQNYQACIDAFREKGCYRNNET